MKKLSLFFLMAALCASAPSWAAESGDVKGKIIEHLDQFSDEEGFQESVRQTDDSELLAAVWLIVKKAKPQKKKKRKKRKTQEESNKIDALDVMVEVNRLIRISEVRQEFEALGSNEERTAFVKRRVAARRSNRQGQQQ